MVHPTKKHNGKLISIIFTPDSISHGEVITGVYTHIDKQTSFELRREDGSINLLNRQQWQIVQVWQHEPSCYDWTFCNGAAIRKTLPH